MDENEEWADGWTGGCMNEYIHRSLRSSRRLFLCQSSL